MLKLPIIPGLASKTILCEMKNDTMTIFAIYCVCIRYMRCAQEGTFIACAVVVTVLLESKR